MEITNIEKNRPNKIGPSKHSESIGFCIRGQNIQSGGVVSQIPTRLSEADFSVCGIKKLMIDEIRDFYSENDTTERVNCAAVACLEITDSPVHVHSETLETYIILEGSGRMLAGKKVHKLIPGTVITLPPGVSHGVCAEGGDPVKVLMTFYPGLAPKQHPEYRDEKILAPSTREFLESL